MHFTWARRWYLYWIHNKWVISYLGKIVLVIIYYLHKNYMSIEYLILKINFCSIAWKHATCNTGILMCFTWIGYLMLITLHCFLSTEGSTCTNGIFMLKFKCQSINSLWNFLRIYEIYLKDCMSHSRYLYTHLHFSC